MEQQKWCNTAESEKVGKREGWEGVVEIWGIWWADRVRLGLDGWRRFFTEDYITLGCPIVSLSLLEMRGHLKMWCDISYVKGEARQSLKRVFYAYLACALNSLTTAEKVSTFWASHSTIQKVSNPFKFFWGALSPENWKSGAQNSIHNAFSPNLKNVTT